MDLFYHCSNDLTFKRLVEFFVVPGKFEIPISSLRLVFERPKTSFSHLCVDLSIAVVLDVIAVDLVTSQFDQALGQQINADVLAFEKDITDFDLSYLALHHEGQVLA
jgi:hypothetical protein